MKAYYNDNDKRICRWLRNLIREGLITPGDVDDRPIQEVRAVELSGYARVHFFCGIAGWDHALNLAGWGEEPVWTGSCPCQPFSVAGRGLGTDDERHLWPVFRELIRECNPSTVFGEQVASKAGRGWLAGVFADLEEMGYNRAGADLCAAGIGAPHVRQRLFWLADSRHKRGRGWPQPDQQERPTPSDRGGVGESYIEGLQGAYGDGSASRGIQCKPSDSGGKGSDIGMVNPNGTKEERLGQECVSVEPEQEARRPRYADAWSRYETVGCSDGKTRRFEPGIHPLAHGVSGRVGLLRGYGNAIVPQVAALFIQAYMEAISDASSSAPQ